MIRDRQGNLLRLRALRRDAARAHRAGIAKALTRAEARLTAAEAIARTAKAAHNHLARSGYEGLVDRAISGPALAHVGQRIDLLADDRDHAVAERHAVLDEVTALRAKLDLATRRLAEADLRHDTWKGRVEDAARRDALRDEDGREQARIEDRIGRGQ
ncbi:MAG: hypothetical protein AAF264_11060 [Pseudomonadota bacterium]